MMKKTLLALSLLGLSSSALAIENGKAESPANYPSLVEMNCTGTIIASKWVMTAAHCTENSVYLVGAVNESNSKVAYINEKYKPESGDFALWKLNDKVFFDKSLFLSDYFVENDYSKVYTGLGFGQTGRNLNSATFKVRGAYTGIQNLSLETLTEAHTVPGDSGSPLLDEDKKIVGIHYGSNNPAGDSIVRHASATRISYVAPFILSTIDAWHTQTIGSVAAGQSTTIEVQSLHVNPVVDDASVTGDINIDVANSSCMTGQIEPFSICTYTVSSTNGYEGVLTLGAGQTVIFNKGKSKPVEPPKPDTGGSSGGSLSIFSLLGLVLLFTRRKAIR
ncbi:trypsin-like serine protease [Shewanella colwelliana]|uniref:trypsin-like serine protease n=1 Tax=Shewanella colwelliana TaxID=23 RepID=UPI003735443E